ncbi:MAG: type II toxin-antitoxin system VapC family toxin [Opitutales bacterium]
MNLLLDTHILIWSQGAPKFLSSEVLGLLNNPGHSVLFSHASIWELELKRAKGNLKMPNDWLARLEKNGFVQVPITLPDIQTSTRLPFFHRDPFDRLLIAQAQRLKADLVTRDHLLGQYGIRVIEA